MMIRLTPIETKNVVIDGVTFTLRPWLGADQIAMANASTSERLLIALRASVIAWQGGELPAFESHLIPRLPADVMAELFSEAAAMSIPTADDVRV